MEFSGIVVQRNVLLCGIAFSFWHVKKTFKFDYNHQRRLSLWESDVSHLLHQSLQLFEGRTNFGISSALLKS